MNFYDDLVMQTQMNYSKYYPIYASGSTPYQLTDKKPLPYSEQIDRLVQEIKEADCVVVGGASGLSAAGGGDFYYEDNDSYRIPSVIGTTGGTLEETVIPLDLCHLLLRVEFDKLGILVRGEDEEVLTFQQSV